MGDMVTGGSRQGEADFCCQRAGWWPLTAPPGAGIRDRWVWVRMPWNGGSVIGEGVGICVRCLETAWKDILLTLLGGACRGQGPR